MKRDIYENNDFFNFIWVKKPSISIPMFKRPKKILTFIMSNTVQKNLFNKFIIRTFVKYKKAIK